jgi:hypothetical protein
MGWVEEDIQYRFIRVRYEKYLNIDHFIGKNEE